MTTETTLDLATAPAWHTIPDMTQAESEGWRISECSGIETETARLERDDATAIFSGDAAAWVHVCAQAESGSAYHQSVLDWLKQNAPVEFKRISDYQEALADKTTWAIVNEAGEFWSNADGWGDQESKTLFYAHEKRVLNLPIGGTWASVG